MYRTLLKSKIHRATVTDADLDYEGSLTLDRNLMDAADLIEYEEVHIFNLTNGHRFSTYVIEGEKGSNEICVNGAAAHLAREGDCLIIASFSSYSESEWADHKPTLVYVDENNNIREINPESSNLRVANNK